MPKPFTFRPRKRPKGEGCHIYPFIHTYLFLVLKGQEKKDVHNDLYLSEILIQDNLGIFFYYRCSKNTKGNLVSNFSLKVKVININTLFRQILKIVIACLLVLSFFFCCTDHVYTFYSYFAAKRVYVCVWGFFFVKPGPLYIYLKMWTLTIERKIRPPDFSTIDRFIIKLYRLHLRNL